MMKKIGRFHVLTDTLLQNRFSHLELAELAIAGGAEAIQFRQKSGSSKEMIKVAGQLKDLCQKSGVTFIVNDRLDWALATQSAGIHLGREDFPIPLARKILGEKVLIGGSAGTLEEARQCLQEGADYIGFGPVFPTSSKADAAPAGGLDLLERVVREIPLPIIAIGGLSPDNIPRVMQTGVYGVAVISAVCCQEDPREAARKLRKLLESSGHA
jgi:thiamine-phosphate pyrophosphorylase